jgi:uncharacterized RDD family membrane protein YckC
METVTLTERERGIEALREGDLDGAAYFLREAVAVDSRDSEARAFLGIACSQRGEHEEAVRALQAAVELQPGEPRYRLNLGVALEGAGDPEGAAAAYRELLKQFPAHPQARARLYALEPVREAPPAAAPSAPWLQAPSAAHQHGGFDQEGAAGLALPMSVHETFGRRFAASLIDGVITSLMMVVIAAIVVMAATAVGRQTDREELRAVLILLAMGVNLVAALSITWAYYVQPQGRYGQTVGKMLLGIRLVGPEGGNPGVGRIVVREVVVRFLPSYLLSLLLGPLWLLCLPIFLLDCLWMLWDPRQQTWHDKIAGMRVERA